MLHANDVQNQRKQAKMAHRLKRGVLAVNETNSGQPGKSKVHPRCDWYRNRLK